MTLKILRLPEVIAITGLSRSSIYSRISESKFPHQIPLGGRAVGWVESQIIEWLEIKIKESISPVDLESQVTQRLRTITHRGQTHECHQYKYQWSGCSECDH